MICAPGASGAADGSLGQRRPLMYTDTPLLFGAENPATRSTTQRLSPQIEEPAERGRAAGLRQHEPGRLHGPHAICTPPAAHVGAVTTSGGAKPIPAGITTTCPAANTSTWASEATRPGGRQRIPSTGAARAARAPVGLGRNRGPSPTLRALARSGVREPRPDEERVSDEHPAQSRANRTSGATLIGSERGPVSRQARGRRATTARGASAGPIRAEGYGADLAGAARQTPPGTAWAGVHSRSNECS